MDDAEWLMKVIEILPSVKILMDAEAEDTLRQRPRCLLCEAPSVHVITFVPRSSEMNKLLGGNERAIALHMCGVCETHRSASHTEYELIAAQLMRGNN